MALQFLQSFSPPVLQQNETTAPPPQADLISLTNLTLTPGLLAPEIWSYIPSTSPSSPTKKKRKLQPATLNLCLLLRPSTVSQGEGGFNSAAKSDSLDSSTVHYGLLSRSIRSAVENQKGGVDVEEVFSLVEKSVLEFAVQGEKKRCSVERVGMEVTLPKLGMFSDEGVRIGVCGVFGEDGGVRGRNVVVRVEGMRLMGLVGVNAVERTGRQPLVVGVRVWFEGKGGREVKEVIGVEQVVAEIVEPTAFETLESLASYTVEELQRRLLSRAVPDGYVQLRMEKPRAVAFADAPAIEVLRRVKSERELGSVDLVVVKPYTKG